MEDELPKESVRPGEPGSRVVLRVVLVEAVVNQPCANSISECAGANESSYEPVPAAVVLSVLRQFKISSSSSDVSARAMIAVGQMKP